MILPVRGEHRMNIETLEYAQVFESKYAQAYLLNDPAHREDHFREVLHNCLSLHRRVHGEDSSISQQKMYVAAAYLHDLFAWSRVNHHILSHEYVVSGDCELLAIFTPEERHLVAKACLEHRASFKGKFSSRFSEAFNAADLGPPNLLHGLKRAYKYARSTAPGRTPEEAVQVAVDHLIDKYGRNGYARRSDVYVTMYSAEIEEYFNSLEGLQAQSYTPEFLEGI